MTQTAPRGERLNIGLFGRRNVGKSSLLNALCGQQVSIVSDMAGTTTDAVSKIYELIPVGPVTFFDTAGIDDTGTVGELRTAATRKIMNKADIALLVTDETGMGEYEKSLADTLNNLKIPFILVLNKSDKAAAVIDNTLPCPSIRVSAANGDNIEELKAQIKEIFQKVADLNKVLDKYDVAKESYWSKFFAAYGQFFGPYGPMGL